jgi:hypothetical protein
VRWTHQPLIVNRDILVEIILIDVLQIMRADEVVVGHAGDGEDGRAINLSIIKAVEQVDRSRRGSGEADAQSTAEFGVSTGGQRRRFLVSAMDITNAALGFAERLH